jgi:hypothetical protein
VSIAPSVLPSMQLQLFQVHVIDPSLKLTHHCLVQILVVLECFTANHIEIPSNLAKAHGSFGGFP